jgi:hypothetical protein
MQLARDVEGGGLVLDDWIIYGVSFAVAAVMVGAVLVLALKRKQRHTQSS